MNESVLKRKRKLLIVSGETSGDFYAASLIDVLLKHEDIDIFSIGGIQCKRRKVKMLCDSTNHRTIRGNKADSQTASSFPD